MKRSVTLSALVLGPCSCAAVLGLEDPGASITELCQCDALSTDALAQRCEDLVRAKENDVEFLQTYVQAGCPSCQTFPACLELLGATPDGAACSLDADCASIHCCPDKTCCTCHECAGAAPHCTSLFDGAADCLFTNHGTLCVSECQGVRPDSVGDPCWTCLVAQDALQQKCKSQVDACNAEPPP